MGLRKVTGGMWKRPSKNGGKDFFSIIIDGKKVMAFPNQYKKADNQPDFTFMCDSDSEEWEIDPYEKKRQSQNNQVQFEEEEEEEDIPF